MIQGSKNRSRIQSPFKKKANNLSLSNLINYKMYRQIAHDSVFSEQSSDIGPPQQLDFNSRFGSSQQEMSLVSLYSDIGKTNLLERPFVDQQNVQALFGKPESFIIFDSVVLKKQLHQKQIQLTRDNMKLKKMVKELLQQKQSKAKNLAALKANEDAKMNINRYSQQVHKKIDLEGEKYRTYYDPKLWFKQHEIFKNNRKQCLDYISKLIEKDLKNLKEQFSKQDKKNKRMQEEKIKLEHRIKEIKMSIKQYKISYRKRAMRQKQEKQKRQIAQLQKSIQKMESIINQSKQSGLQNQIQ